MTRPMARGPCGRVIQKQLVDKLALALLEGRFHGGDKVLADAIQGEVTLERTPPTQTSAMTL